MLTKAVLREYWKKFPEVEEQLKSWHMEASRAKWRKPADVIKNYPGTKVLSDNRIVFNIKGNKYRLIVKINYEYQITWVRFIGTHNEYDVIDATKI